MIGNETERDKIYRGCLTDPSEERLLCDRQEKDNICIKCAETECNDMPKLREPSLSCVHCHSKISEECGFEQDKTSAIRCKKSILFGRQESCYTLIKDGEFR